MLGNISEDYWFYIYLATSKVRLKSDETALKSLIIRTPVPDISDHRSLSESFLLLLAVIHIILL